MSHPISISHLAWSPAQDAAVLELLRKHGVQLIDAVPAKFFADVATASDAEIAAARRRWNDAGIAFAGMQSLLFGTQGLNVFGDAATQTRLLEHLRHVCRVGGGLSATHLVFGSPRNRDRSGLDDATALEIAAAFFRRLGDVAAGFGVDICLEPNPPAYNSNFMRTADETAAVVRATAHPAIRMQFDTGALTINGEDPAAVLAAHAAHIGHIHASDPHLVPLGTGGCDHAAMGGALKNALCGKVVCVEMAENRASAEENLIAIDAALALVTSVYRK